MTGSSDGVVRMWSSDLIEVAAEAGAKKSNSSRAGSEEGFVLVTGDADDQPSVDYSWRRQLVYRGKLTMHTAFERPDNVEPAAVTALSVSKDHKNIYVGDARGRVFSWMVASKPGKGMVDHWVKDENASACVDCGVKFTIYERRHHCRNCGQLYCSSCSKWSHEIPKFKISKPVRVCKACYDSLTAEKAAASSNVAPATAASPKKL